MKDKKKETEELAVKLFMMWSLNEGTDGFRAIIPEVHENSFICQVLSKRMEAFDLKVVVPDHLSSILEICTESNPGMSLYMLSEILKTAKVQSLPYTITSMDFALTFPMSFPVIEDSKIYQEYQKKWDSQKYEKDGHLLNRVDTPEFWKEVIGRKLYD